MGRVTGQSASAAGEGRETVLSALGPELDGAVAPRAETGTMERFGRGDTARRRAGEVRPAPAAGALRERPE